MTSLLSTIRTSTTKRKKIDPPQPEIGGILIARLGSENRALEYRRIESSFHGRSGIFVEGVNYVTGIVKIRFDPKKYSLEEVLAEVEKAKKAL